MTLSARDAERMQDCLVAGGVVVFPADTVYGVGCDPENAEAVRRLYELKGRPATRPAAVMLFALQHALDTLPELGERERKALAALLPGPLTVVLPNRRRRFPLAGGSGVEGAESLGLRVPLLTAGLGALRQVSLPVLQSSANISGESEVRRLADVSSRLRAGADLVLDGGELPGLASTVLDLRGYEQRGEWQVLREGPVDRAALQLALSGSGD
jgi:L-threonylcarbamoyladenylate synthase